MKPMVLIVLGVTLIIFAGLYFTGCLPSMSVGKKYYQLYLPPDGAAINDAKPIPKPDKVLMVESVEVEDIYNDFRVVYRTSPYHLNYYSYNYWVKKPEVLVRDSIVDYLSKNNLFKKVITGFKGGEPDLLMKAAVHIMEEYDRPEAWFAHLKMDIEIRRFKSGQQVLLHTFDRRQQMPQKKVEHLPVALSKILQEELDKVINKLAN